MEDGGLRLKMRIEIEDEGQRLRTGNWGLELGTGDWDFSPQSLLCILNPYPPSSTPTSHPQSLPPILNPQPLVPNSYLPSSIPIPYPLYTVPNPYSSSSIFTSLPQSPLLNPQSLSPVPIFNHQPPSSITDPQSSICNSLSQMYSRALIFLVRLDL